MISLEPLVPAGYSQIPWKNGRGALTVIDRAGAEGWDRSKATWHFGRTTIIEEGPFSDYSGFERLQVAIKGEGLVLVAPDREISLTPPLTVQRYDGGLPVRTRLAGGPVEVVNLIANKSLFDIDLRVARAGDALLLARGRHVAYVPSGRARISIDDEILSLEEDHAVRIRASQIGALHVAEGTLLLASVTPLG